MVATQIEIGAMLAAIVFAPALARAQMPVVVAPARTVEAPATITLVGAVEAARASRVASQVAGLVRAMPARQGDAVAAGQVLCEFDTETAALTVAEAQARLDSLRAQHDELLAGTRREELDRLRALFDEAVADFDRWRFEMERIESLYAGSESNAKEYNDTRAEFLTAQRRKIAAQARYDEAVAGPRSQVIARAAAEVAAQRAVLGRAETDLGRMTVRAPYAGVVTQRVTEVGEWVAAGGTVVELADIATVLVSVDLPESAYPYVAVGDAARVSIDALGRSFDGAVQHVIPRADAKAHTFPVEVEVPNETRALAAGLFARVALSAGARETVVVVPKDAIVEREGTTYVAVVDDDPSGRTTAMLRAVALGNDVGDSIIVTSPNVPPGTLVVIKGNERMFPFPMPVLIVDENGTPVRTAPPEPEPQPSPTSVVE